MGTRKGGLRVQPAAYLVPREGLSITALLNRFDFTASQRQPQDFALEMRSRSAGFLLKTSFLAFSLDTINAVAHRAP
ncbi:hypothetical protein GW7_07624 [Heterocephalus glaber]|uniref:Uncharacterized protein n=1 Tax=Heterocephalus glaber TaxID=10181 RepID=G5BY98_HETGA|nr:hypothetical protein GW7_07624 [Heterocephalus glaber]